MIYIKNDPIVFTWKDIDRYLDENTRCNYILETEYQGVQYAIFYHGFPNKKYVAAHWTEDQYKWADVPAIAEADWIEDLEIDGIVADNGDVIYSRYPAERRTSDDGSVWIRGSDASSTDPQRRCTLTIFKGRLEYWENDKYKKNCI